MARALTALSTTRAGGDAYAEHDPSPALAPWVEAFWIQARPPGAARPESLRVLPDGRAHLLVDLSRPARPASLVVGPRRTALVVPCPTWTHVLGVRFRPGAARRFLGIPLAEIADVCLPLGDIRRDTAAFLERVAEADEGGRALAALDGELAAWGASPREPEPRVRSAVERLFPGPERLSVGELARELGITRQHLARLFRAEVGYGPRTLSRVLRLQRALLCLSGNAARPGNGRPSLAAVALEAGYFDQAHMNAEFRTLVGLTPGRLGP